ncbi:VWA domain-containing protein [Nocardia sp. NPDC057663]|uniref:vWA domain-containing protein n=1 Tax=Nocardia sp. NPDC057663 TaxID=3346201 RepID=UPI00366C917F
MSRFRTLTAALTAAALTLLPAVLPAAAHADPAQYAPTMLILDASGSMQRPDQGATMMDSAKKAVRTFVDSAPAEAKVGLTTYGTGTGNDEADKAAGCRDVQILQPPNTIDKPALTSAVDSIQARGWTPMGTALRQAAEALPSSGPRSIVLVSDGDDTCAPPDPCEVAKELKQKGIDLVVHSIGFAVDDKARAQLTCMAQATGGSYSDAADGAALERILPRVSSAALRNYQATGTPITGTATYGTAPVAKPGQYLDTIGQHEKRFYAVDVPAGATAYFTGIVAFPRAALGAATNGLSVLELRVYGHDGAYCNIRERELESRTGDGVAFTISNTLERATEEPSGGSSDSCKGGGRYYYELNWDEAPAGLPARLPVELLIGIEPGVTDPGPSSVTKKTTFAAPAGPAEPVSGGGSFTVATALDGSGKYTDTIQSGEYVFYKVRLNWGQGLAYRVRFTETGGAGYTTATNVTTTVYSPLGGQIHEDTNAYTGRQATDLEGATVPIRYANRDADDIPVQQQSVAGWYYIAVKIGMPSGTTAMPPTPVELDLTVAGDTEAGPTYLTGSPDVLGEQSQPSTEKSVAVSGSASSTPWVAVAALGVGVVALIGIGIAIWVVTRRRA